ncbi:MAG: MFS transporter [Pseudomonadota bacterium]
MIRPGWTTTAGWYGFFFLFGGAHLPFWPLWLADWGLSAAEIGTYTAAGVAARVAFGVFLPWIADVVSAPRRVLASLCLIASAIYFAHIWIETRPLLLAATIGASAALAGALPIGDALALRAAERGPFTYATARSVGSAAFLFANLACGLAVARYGSEAAIWWIALSLAPLIWLSWRHPGGAGAQIGGARLSEAARLLKAPAFIAALIASAATMGSHAVIYAYGSIHWRAQGIGDEVIGALWAFGVAVEVVVMAVFGAAMIARLGVAGSLMLGGAVGVVRWAAMTLDPSLFWLWPLQALHSLTFTATHLGLMAFIAAAAPVRLASTAQGLASSLAGGVLMAGATALAALIYPIYGAGAFWLAAGLAALGVAAAVLLHLVWKGERLEV